MQLRAEEDSARKIGGGADGDDGGRGDKEGLNLKVAHYVNHVSQMNKRFVENVLQVSISKKQIYLPQTPGPKPHPNWVYRHHFTAEERTEVQRSLSMLQQVSLLTAL